LFCLSWDRLIEKGKSVFRFAIGTKQQTRVRADLWGSDSSNSFGSTLMDQNLILMTLDSIPNFLGVLNTVAEVDLTNSIV